MAAFARIKTYARIRPFNESEVACKTCEYPVVQCNGGRSVTFNPSSLKAIAPVERFSTSRGRRNYDQIYEFERVFGTQSSENDIYESVALPLLKSALNGNDASMFAYGATGCGKSHTIDAIQDRICRDIFARKQELGSRFTVKLTYLQLYNEKIIDLLPGSSSRMQPLDMRDPMDGRRQVDVAGLMEYELETLEESRQLIARGNTNRVIAATRANSQSSRSHAILRWHLELRDPATGAPKYSSLSIIDLAGSERAQSTRNRGERLGEGAKINKSLLALGNCITARAQRRKFVPYRESKLTRLLRFSLQGTCDTAMIVCVSPSVSHFEETRNSLEYGVRAASIARPAKPPGAQGRHPLHSAELVAEIERLSLWRSEVSTAFCSHIPELSAFIELRGGIANVSGETFVNAVIQSQRPADVAADHVSDADNASPLKRRLRNISPVHSRGSMLQSPQSVKRLHV